MIRTDRLTKRFRRLTAVHEVTMEVPKGAIFALVGPNGAGKSTLIKTALNVLTPDSGSATVLGVDSQRLGPAELARIGYVSESQRLPLWMTVAGFLRYRKPFYPEWDDAIVARLVERLGLPLHRRLSELSRGSRLKTALISALAYEPSLLVLDEPFSGLDVLVRDEISETLLGDTNSPTILLASHDLADLESFASHVAYMSDGELLFSEEISVLMARYRQVEVTVDEGAANLRGEWPAHWLGLETGQRVVRFTDARHDPVEVQAHFPRARSIQAEPLSLRGIFVALARRHREQTMEAR